MNDNNDDYNCEISGSYESKLSSLTVIEKSPNKRFAKFDKKLTRCSMKKVYMGWDSEKGIDIAWNCADVKIMNKTQREQVLNEMSMYHKFDHDNIIKIYSTWVTFDKSQIVFATEISDGGCLRLYIQERNINSKIIKNWTKQILSALEYMHSNQFIHGDLSCLTIYVMVANNKIVIGDLGCSQVKKEKISKYNQQVFLNKYPEFLSPELIDGDISEAVDIYAFGMVLLELATKFFPYEECTKFSQILNKIINKIEPESLKNVEDKDLQNLIMKCLKNNKKLSVKDLIKDKFFN